MISDAHRFIFIHVPKTGGTSIEKQFEQTKDFTCRHHHQTAAETKEQHADLYERYFTFAFVRNPWDRLVSEYHYVQHLPNGPHASQQWAKDEYAAFKAFTSEHPTFRDYIFHLDAFPFPPYHEVSQYDYLFDSSGNCLVDFVGQFEHLETDFSIVCDILSIKRRSLPLLNKTNHKHYSTYYDDETRDIVLEKYRLDINTFGYTFYAQ